MHPDWLRPDWQADGVGGLMTTRQGGVSRAPFDSLNLRVAVGDDPHAVAQNQRLLADAIGATPVWLNQVHGARVVRLTGADLGVDAAIHDADGSVTTEPGIACAAQVADCLPVLFAAPRGRAVGAAHAGWRGLAAGVLEATLAQVCEAADCAPEEVQTWLGACIGPQQFEVGPDVLEAFGTSPVANDSPRFIAKSPGKWYADLPALARGRLRAAGILAIFGGAWCSVSEPSRFFSFRRDRVTGRMAAVVWIDAARAD
ncbi:MAG: peptidoglycan editing factor PgeF [Burkholderiales bacterium]